MIEQANDKTIGNDFIQSANVWEDADALCEALDPCCKNGRILSIASSGDNVLALLTIDPKEIVAVDKNRAQLACLELRISAFKQLDYFALLSFMGITEAVNRQETYLELREDLSPIAQSYWDAHLPDIEHGIIHSGKFERYLKLLRQYIFPLIHSKEKRDLLFIARSHPDRLKFYEEEWDSYLWRFFFKLFFSRWVVGKEEQLEFLHYVQGDAGDRLLRRTKHVMTELTPNSNPYLNYLIKGNYDLEALPRYLQAEYKKTITSRLDRIKLVCAPIQQAVHDGNFDGFNLSDILESMKSEEYELCYELMVAHSNPLARIVYWDRLHPHTLPENIEPLVNVQSALSEVLHWRNKAWFYQAIHVDEVKENAALALH